MLYFTLLVAIAFYGMLYLLWLVMEPHLGQPTITLFHWRQTLLYQSNTEVLVLLKWLIIVVGLYLVMDLAISIVRQWRRRRRQPSIRLSGTGIYHVASHHTAQRNSDDLSTARAQSPQPVPRITAS